MIEEKKCPRCGVTKPFSEFSKNANRKDGRQWHCKSCSSELYRISHKVTQVRPYTSRLNLEPLTERKCSTCKTVKPISEFYRNAHEPGGFAYRCKLCSNKYTKEYHRKNYIPKGRLTGLNHPMVKKCIERKEIKKYSKHDKPSGRIALPKG